MQIIVSPTKKMIVNTSDFGVQAPPQYLTEARQILTKMKTLDYETLKALWHCSDKLARENFDWLQKMSLDHQLTPAILSYSGIQYQYMAPGVFTAPALAYVQANLRILSAFYGILRPFDGIVPYRLEMQSALQVGDEPNLYAFWGNKLYRSLDFSTGPVLNLASQEYAKAITPFLQSRDQLINVIFGSIVDGKIKTKATLAKMARGEMVRYLAEHAVTTVAGITAFDHPDWRFDTTRSTPDKLVFINTEQHH